MFRRKFKRRVKPRTLWFGEDHRDFTETFGVAAGVQPVTSWVPIWNTRSSDVTTTLAEEMTLAAPTQGALMGMLAQGAYRTLRLVTRLQLGPELQPDDATGTPKSARHIVVRLGIFKGLCDQAGALLNADEFRLEGPGAVAGFNQRGVLSRENRWVWMYEAVFTNYAGRNPNTYTTVSQNFANPNVLMNAQGPWATAGGRFAYMTQDDVLVDIRNMGTTGPEERWFLARYCADLEQTQPAGTDGGRITINYHWNPRALVAKSTRFRKRPGF